MPTLGNQGATALVQRTCTVQIGIPGSPTSLLLKCGNGVGLDVSFKIQRGIHVTAGSLKPQPNTCDLRIWGLTRNHRNALAKSTVTTAVSPGTKAPIVPCIITAGYAGGASSILFSGELRAANFVTDGADKFVCELTTGDGDQALSQARLSLMIPPGSTMQQTFQQVLSAMGVLPGNMTAALALIAGQPTASQIFAKGAALKGSAAEIMADLCRSTGLSYSIQNGALSITQVNQPLPGQVLLISEQSGMIGNATVDTKGIVSVKTLMLPGITPGMKIAIQSINVQGGFKILSAEYTGNTSAGSPDWSIAIEAQRY
jgi:hypothetical protein